MQYSVRRYQDGDEDEIVNLLDTAFNGWPKFDIECSPLEHWKWKYLNNQTKVIAITIGLENNKMIGCSHTVPRNICISGETFFASLGSDLAVDSHYKKFGIAIELIQKNNLERKNAELDFVYFETGVPFLIKSYRRRFTLMPFKIIHRIKIINIGLHFQKKKYDKPFFKKNALRAFKLFQNTLSFIRKRYVDNSNFKFTNMKYFDKRIQVFWREIKRYYIFIGQRNQLYLNWRYCDSRGGNYKIRCIESEDVILGFSVLKINRNQENYPEGYIVDLLSLPGRSDVIQMLLSDAVRYFNENGVNIIHCLTVKGHPNEKILKRHGFINIRRKVMAFYYPFKDISQEMSLVKNSLLWIALFVMVGCASKPQVAYKPPQMPPLPPEIAQKKEVNLTERFMKLLTPTEQLSQPLPKSSPKATETRPN